MLLQFEVRFAYWRTSNSSFLWFLDFGTGSFFPATTIFVFGDTRIPKRNQENPTTWSFFINIVFLVSEIWHLSKMRAPGNDEDPSKTFPNLGYKINIYLKTWTGNVVMWYRYLLKTWRVFATNNQITFEITRPNTKKEKNTNPKNQTSRNKKQEAD